LAKDIEKITCSSDKSGKKSNMRFASLHYHLPLHLGVHPASPEAVEIFEKINL